MDDACDLTAKQCIPCRGGVPPLAGAELDALSKQLGGAWKVVDGHHLEREYTFPDFASALAFTNRVGALAESEGHHPDIHPRVGQGADHALDAQDRRSHRERFHPGGEGRAAAALTGSSAGRVE